MDARITKQRLGILLSYDWLKILGVIAVAVTALCVLFTVIATRPTTAQMYDVYTYGGLRIGDESAGFVRSIEGRFSYDILTVGMQNFEDGSLGEQALTARRGVLEGDAVFAADYTEKEDEATPFTRLCRGYTHYEGPEKGLSGFYDIPAFMRDAERYLANYFDDTLTDEDETLTRETPIEERTEEAFNRRNGADKRFKTAAQKLVGVAKERERVLSMRKNYIAVQEAFERGDLTTVDYEYTVGSAEEDVELPKHYATVGICLQKLTGIEQLFYYIKDGRPCPERLVLLFFDNGARETETKFENLALIAYLLENYAPAHS